MRSNRAHAPRLAFNTEGTATLELAVLLPFLFALSFGVFEFGHLVYQYHLITSGVRDASRYLAGLPQDSADEEAKNIAMWGTANPDLNDNLRVSWWNDASTINITTETGDDTGYRGGTIAIVKVQATVPYQSLGFLEFLGIEPITLTARHEERLYQNR